MTQFGSFLLIVSRSVDHWIMDITFYNVFFTVFPPFVMGVFDQFVNARLLDRYPQLYQLGQKKKFFNVIFWGWIANGFYHSAIIFFCAQFLFINMVINWVMDWLPIIGPGVPLFLRRVLWLRWKGCIGCYNVDQLYFTCYPWFFPFVDRYIPSLRYCCSYD